LGYTPNTFIKTAIDPSVGLEKLNGKKFSEHQKCLPFMIEKSQLNDKPGSIKRAEKPLANVNRFNFVFRDLDKLGRIQLHCCCDW
jgi:hypothetical protein